MTPSPAPDRLTALIDELGRFGRHRGSCNLQNREPFSEKARAEYFAKGCTCGLHAALAALRAEAASLQERLAKSEAINAAHDLGWEYDPEHGAWYNDEGELECVEEHLVSYLAGLSKLHTTTREVKHAE